MSRLFYDADKDLVNDEGVSIYPMMLSFADEDDGYDGGELLSCANELPRKNATNLNGSSGTEDYEEYLNSSVDDRTISPAGLDVMKSPRKCTTRRYQQQHVARNSAYFDTEGEEDHATKNVETTPPYKRVRALRLFDSPKSPTTLLESSSIDRPTPQLLRSANHFRSRIFPNLENSAAASKLQRRCQQQQQPLANVNPFTPNGMLLNNSGIKRRRTKSSLNGSLFSSSLEEFLEEDEDCSPIEQPTKKIALRETNIPRYNLEFLELCRIGSGQFGSVFKCINRLDGCVYALKKSLKPVAGSVNEQNAMNEVYAHAVLGKHPNVVRYYSAWAENDHMLIQNEYCNGGSLADSIVENQRSGRSFNEQELKLILIHITEGLKYIHQSNLAHMDIKPGNIFISRNSRPISCRHRVEDDGFEDEDFEEGEVVYKIGDLGHVTSLTNPQVEEGDCRYLPLEILQEDYSHLLKADVFALGLTVFEAGGGGDLPKNGDQWHSIRAGNLPRLDRYSKDFNNLLKQMIHPNPEIRPSSSALCQHRVLCPYGDKTKAQLRRELNAERLKNELLLKKLQDAAKCFEGITSTAEKKNLEKSNRLIGRKVNRSVSVTNF